MGYRRFRQGNGRFRRGTLGDIGMAHCRQCGAIYWPDLTPAYSDAGFIDPVKLREAREACPNCDGGTGKASGLCTDTAQGDSA